MDIFAVSTIVTAMSAPDHSAVIDGLTPKQCEAVELVAAGYQTKEVAQKLGISPRGVEVRIDAVRAKLGNVPRHEMVRIFNAHRTWDQTTCGPIPVAAMPPHGSPLGHRHGDDHLVLRDAAVFSHRAPWDDFTAALRPGARPSDLGPGQRMAAMLAGAIGIAILLLVLLGIAAGMENVLQG